ncbi:MAG TPA: hypothetical protein V6D03_02780, partial [Candidatus Caenarcaniphilales bacterium]
MNSRYVSFLLSATTFFCASTLTGRAAQAHNFDYCVDILQAEAEEAANKPDKPQKFNIKDSPDYAAIAQDCEKDLGDEGFITPQQVKADPKKANAVINNEYTEDELKPEVVERRENEVERLDARLENIRRDVCAEIEAAAAIACPIKNFNGNGDQWFEGDQGGSNDDQGGGNGQGGGDDQGPDGDQGGGNDDQGGGNDD